jgi:small basic protein (TIGR04137 family)
LIFFFSHFLSTSLNLVYKTMSQHNSFKSSDGGGKKNRTVLKRFERVDLLRKRGEWTDGQRVVGLKKTKPEE